MRPAWLGCLPAFLIFLLLLFTCFFFLYLLAGSWIDGDVVLGPGPGPAAWLPGL